MKQFMYFVKGYHMTKLQIKVQPDFWFTLSLALVFIPVPWLLSWLVAASIHEIFHYIALRICGYSVKQIHIGASGTGMESDLEPGFKMILCALAGPISGFLLLLLVHIFPRIAICGFLQSICNILPIYSLDGGRALRGILFILFKENTALKLCMYTEKIIIILITALLCYGTIRLDLGIVPLLLIIVFLARKKYLANHSGWRYNMVSRK